MSRYTFRKPTIGQKMDMFVASTKQDWPALIRLLDDLAADDILNLPFTELGAVVEDYARACRYGKKRRYGTVGLIVDFLANLLGKEDEGE